MSHCALTGAFPPKTTELIEVRSGYFPPSHNPRKSSVSMLQTITPPSPVSLANWAWKMKQILKYCFKIYSSNFNLIVLLHLQCNWFRIIVANPLVVFVHIWYFLLIIPDDGPFRRIFILANLWKKITRS